MKVMIELDIPDGQRIPTEHEIRMLTSPDWHGEWWHIDDIMSQEEDLNEEEAREVLRLMAKYADANVGISWETINVWADWVRENRPPVECECCHAKFDAEDMINHEGKMVCGDCELDLKEAQNQAEAQEIDDKSWRA